MKTKFFGESTIEFGLKVKIKIVNFGKLKVREKWNFWNEKSEEKC